MTSRSIIDRFTSPRNRSPILPLHNPQTTRSSSQYAMEELEPWPQDDDAVFHDRKPSVSRSRKSPIPSQSLPRSPSPDAWHDKASSIGSPPKSRPMFAGPPPPIASSMVIRNRSTSGQSSAGQKSSSGHIQGIQAGIGSLLSDYKHEKQPAYKAGSIWRGIRRREKALENEVQQLLDLQASGLVAGSNAVSAAGSEMDAFSDTGSSTPTGTFYSTATSKSRMINSLQVPTRSTPDGNVIPVRQPKSTRPRGLRSVRTGLRRSISALAQLKVEEDAYVDDALAERRKALSNLDRLRTRKDNVSAELQTLEENEEEPLGQELRELGVKYDSITQDIRVLEEKLVGMRNRRRWLKDKMEDVKNRREAGLSGYRGALKDVDSEVTALMNRPPIYPLDLEALQQDGQAKVASTGGLEFLRLIPERRTMDMAKAWWESEISVLEQRKAQVDADRQALDEGGVLWVEVMRLVSDYETRLRHLMKGESPSSPSKGKEKELPHEQLIRDQLPEMDRVVEELGTHMRHAEDKGWTLLICAIGAELEAFREAQEMLRGLAAGDDAETHDSSRQMDADSQDPEDRHDDESSDNEVPPDLLVSRADDGSSYPPSVANPDEGSQPQKVESENNVPPEFLAEHKERLD